MRSRYSAYALTEVRHIVQTTHPDHRDSLDEQGIRAWSTGAEWLGLEVLATSRGGPGDADGEVEFIARYVEKGETKEYHERAQFENVDGVWYFTDGSLVRPGQYVRPAPKIGRNAPCPCGSGKKHKKCCGA
jgi:SEC-C motif-containing protein